MSMLHELARAVGLQIEWQDAAGTAQRVSDQSLTAILSALGHDAQSDAAAARSLAHHREQLGRNRFVSADRGEEFILPLQWFAAGELTAGNDAATGELRLETGAVQLLSLSVGPEGALVPGIAVVGYHKLIIAGQVIRLAIAPPRCRLILDATNGRQAWGVSLQIPSLCNGVEGQAGAFGDLGALAAAAAPLGRAGADALAISPVHALFPADASRFSPYAPSSRLFLNILLGNPGLLGHPQADVADTGCNALIDWSAAIPARIGWLRQVFAMQTQETRDEVSKWRLQMGPALKQHALFDALHTHFFATGATGWQGWPEPYHDPAGEAAQTFATDHCEEVDFFVFAQWLARISLDHAQAQAREAGMTIGLICDLAVGMDAGGSHAWGSGGELLDGLSVGAPPDQLGPDGQDWGITALSPFAMQRNGFQGFIATLRAGLGSAGGIRIDHALGLRRLWVIPAGASSGEGAYLSYPFEDMLRIAAIESHRASAVVIGEDLGTVPAGLRERLKARAVAGMRVLWFEQAGDDFLPPAAWDHDAVAMTGTHDLVTIAGWWTGRDQAWNRQIGRGSHHHTEAEDKATRALQRQALWNAFVASGAASGACPPTDEPAAVIVAALRHLAMTPCPLVIATIEDLLGLVEQPNLPGTIDEHPNWRRRLSQPLAMLLALPEVAARTDALNESCQ
ncbi:4-alpha-glucanotransferase [Croceicoccus sp. F390]|uniref:4-alpha-glucanotransferase n=1 Tax=Croceicoccus esteveae TaxID=3075597 RepID=A0ABU2ZH64_9SPHN|nr:4-alpha-glucanotransferase [Croceicoccus sp. F390]MDT0575701.1 4-alpha-glucanotransferase [Croceicoccus sp. F390]